MLVLDLDWVSGASSPPYRVVNFVGGEVQQGCRVQLIRGMISGLPKRTPHRISSDTWTLTLFTRLGCNIAHRVAWVGKLCIGRQHDANQSGCCG